jgi:hypothetical protein
VVGMGLARAGPEDPARCRSVTYAGRGHDRASARSMLVQRDGKSRLFRRSREGVSVYDVVMMREPSTSDAATTTTVRDVETRLAIELWMRGLRRTHSPLHFAHQGKVVQLKVLESAYRGHVIAIVDDANGDRQFRACGGDYDWDAIASFVRWVALRRRVEEARAAGAPPAPRAADELILAAVPSSDGRFHVKLAELDLDAGTMARLLGVLGADNDERPMATAA